MVQERGGLARAAGEVSGALVAVSHQRLLGKWRVQMWAAAPLAGLLSGWSPPPSPLSCPGTELVRLTGPLAGMGPLALELEPQLLRHLETGVVLCPPGRDASRLFLWLAFAGRPEIGRLEGLAALLGSDLQPSIGLYRELIDELPAAFILVDLDGIIRDCSASVRELGYEPAELIGKPSTVILPEEERKRLRARLRSSPRVDHHVATARRRSGETVTIDMMATVVFDANQEPVGIFGVGRDFRGEQRVAQYRRAEAVRRMVTGIAHELNNPLQIIVGKAELMREMKLPEMARRRSEQILAAASRCRDLVDGLLRLNLKHGGVPQVVDLGEVVSRAVQTVAAEAQDLRSAIDVTVDLDVPLIEGIAFDLEQALVHVLRNACQAVSQQAQPRIGVRIERVDDRVRLTIEDTGAGMSRETLEHAFEPFFTTRELGQGIGLGLSIAQGIVQEHGGSISIDSGVGGGTQVVIELMLRPELRSVF